MNISDKQRYSKYLADIIKEMIFLLQYQNASINDIDEKDQRAIERAFEIIGEATKRLANSSFYTKYPDVEWSDMARTRDFIIHHYDNTELKIYLRIINTSVTKTLPIIKNILELENGAT